MEENFHIFHHRTKWNEWRNFGSVWIAFSRATECRDDGFYVLTAPTFVAHWECKMNYAKRSDRFFRLHSSSFCFRQIRTPTTRETSLLARCRMWSSRRLTPPNKLRKKRYKQRRISLLKTFLYSSRRCCSGESEKRERNIRYPSPTRITKREKKVASRKFNRNKNRLGLDEIKNLWNALIWHNDEKLS